MALAKTSIKETIKHRYTQSANIIQDYIIYMFLIVLFLKLENLSTSVKFSHDATTNIYYNIVPFCQILHTYAEICLSYNWFLHAGIRVSCEKHY